ncbi:pilus assembly protein PilP [Herbaspirillum robiniae]|uniref:pilus assembly protein PilP n=1 Tax=Herbaspirillum robiniae TaxID=2014887 RepID=UPI003D772BD0
MKISIAAAAVLAPLAGAFAAVAAGGARPDEASAATAWLAEARRQARPDLALAAPVRQSPVDEPEAPEELLRDPFGLDEEAAADHTGSPPNRHANAQEEDDERPAAPHEPAIRLVGTLVQESAAYAVLKIDGATHRVRVGDTLPGELGRVLQIREDAVTLSGPGLPHLVAIDSAPAPHQAKPASRPGKPARPTKRRLIRPGDEA